MSFTIKFDDLEKISKNILPSDTLNKIIPDVNSAISKFHNTLEARVRSLYKNKRPLDSILVKSSFSSTKVGLDYQLVYSNIKTPMADYPYTQSSVTVKNSIPFGMRNGFVRYTKVNKAKSVKVNIRSSGSPSLPRIRTAYKKFVGSIGGKERILVRLQKATWLQIPNELNPDGIRAPYKELFGPSLARLAEITYDKDVQMQTAKDQLADEISNAFTKGWK
jgi:hypothetical protein